MYISLGCYTETLIQAFKAYSYDTDVTYDTVDKTMFIYYEKTSDLIDDDLIEKITTRHTDEPQMILRIGYASKYGTNAAIRRDLVDYVRVR
ncbi:MAG: hypothetical protein IJR96_01605 [Pseudobutyrivibrio sp.]|nr:hypothetical protein [Pseudobutyrivibrio sp.]